MTNSILIAMLDSGTVTMSSTTAEVITKVEEVMNAPKVQLAAPKDIEESAADILMFGC